MPLKETIERQPSKLTFTNLTGKFIPRDSVVRNPQVEEAFWTPERIRLYQKIIEAVNRELEPFDAPKIEFRREQVKLSKKKAIGFVFGTHDWESGEIELCPEFLDSNEKSAGIPTHEYLHNLSLRLKQENKASSPPRGRRAFLMGWFLSRFTRLHRQTTGDSETQNIGVRRRDGLQMSTNSGKKSQELFSELNEGTIDKTTQQILKKCFSLDYPPAYRWPVEIIDACCQAVSLTFPQKYPSPEDVFRVFKKQPLVEVRLGNWQD